MPAENLPYQQKGAKDHYQINRTLAAELKTLDWNQFYNMVKQHKQGAPAALELQQACLPAP